MKYLSFFLTVADKKDSFLSAKGPTKVHPLFTFQKGKSGQTIRMVENHVSLCEGLFEAPKNVFYSS